MPTGAVAAAHAGHNHGDGERSSDVSFGKKYSEKTQAERASRAGMGGADSFESWQAQLMGPAKPAPGASNLSVMPPKSMRLFEGPMEKKAIASASGVKWQALFVQARVFQPARGRERERERERARARVVGGERERGLSQRERESLERTH
jgi:hypothetical protein